MEKEDLIKQLENIEVPEIGMQSHQRRLRLTLLTQHQKLRFGTGQDSGYFKEKTIMIWTKRLVPAGVALALILVVGFTVINPKLQTARAMEIAKSDPQIQQLMKDYGVEIKEVKLQDGKAYVLLALPEEKLPPLSTLKGGEETAMRGPGQFYITYQDPKTGEVIESSGSIAEIDLKGKKVEKLEMVEETMIALAPLTEEEKARAIEIAKSEPKIQEMIPDLEEREVIVKPLPPLKLRFDEDSDSGMEITSADPNEQKRANVIFKSDKHQDIITVNLSTRAIAGAMSTGEIGRQESEYPAPLKPIKEETLLYDVLPDEGVVISEGQPSGQGSAIDEKNLFVEILHNIAEKGDDKIKELLKDNDYEILEVIKSKPVVEKTETSETTRVKTITVVLEKESAGEKYWITIDMGTMTVKSIEKE